MARRKNKNKKKTMEKLPPEEPPYQKGWIQGEFVVLKVANQEPNSTVGLLLDSIISVSDMGDHRYEILTSAKKVFCVENERTMKDFMEFLFPSEFSQDQENDSEDEF